MEALVTGAAGFIGSHLCDRLLADGHNVTGIDCFTDYYARGSKEANLAPARASDRFRMLHLDLSVADLTDVLDGIDVVFHLAAQPGVRGSWGERFETYSINNIRVTQRLLEALKRRPARLVYASSSSIYGSSTSLPVHENDLPQPISPYGVTKLAAEHLVRLYAEVYRLHAVSVRYFTVYGPRQRPDMAFMKFIDAAHRGAALEVYGDGSQTRDFTFVGDAVDATVRAREATSGSIFNVGGGARASVSEVIDLLGTILGSAPAIAHLPLQSGDPTHTWASTDRARDELGWSPKTSLADGLAAQIEWASALQRTGAGI